MALLLAAVIAWGSLMPASELPEDLPWDKANHLLAYAGLAALVALACDRAWLSVGLAVGYGVLIELAQIPGAWPPGGRPLGYAGQHARCAAGRTARLSVPTAMAATVMARMLTAALAAR